MGVILRKTSIDLTTSANKYQMDYAKQQWDDVMNGPATPSEKRT